MHFLVCDSMNLFIVNGRYQHLQDRLHVITRIELVTINIMLYIYNITLIQICVFLFTRAKMLVEHPSTT